jgi:predicted esterase
MKSGSRFFEQRQSLRRLGSWRLRWIVGICLVAGCQHPPPVRSSEAGARAPDAMPVATAHSSLDIAHGSTAGSSSATPNTTESITTEPTSTSPFPEQTWTELPVTGFLPALLWYRKGAPLFVVTHGAGGHAAWHCEHYHRLLDGRATLLCPRGKLRYAKDPSQGYYYPDHLALRREVIAVVEGFEALATPSGASRPYVYAGYSQGATMGALAFGESGGLFSQLVLVEGGFADWSQALVNRFRETGGKSVLFVCGTKQCATQAAGAVHRFVSSGLGAKSVWARGAGHVPDGAVGQALSNDLGFLLEADPRWQGFSPRPEDYSAPRGE